MLNRFRLLSFFACGAAAIGLAGCTSGTSAASAGSGGRGGRGGRGGGGDAPVVTAKVSQRDVPVDIAAIGNVEAYATISVRSQVTGQLQEISFQEGDLVKTGQLLFTLDRRPFEAALAQAEANLSRDKALEAQAEAQLNRDAANAEYQQVTAERQSQLTQRGILSKDASQLAQSQADATAALVKADKANVESTKAELAAQEAAVQTARVQLDYCVIKSPIDGRTGNLSVKVGSLITANQLEMITISRIQPVYVTFAVPATHLSTIKTHMTGGKLAVTAIPQDADAQAATGALSFIDNAVDMTTDTIKLKATFDNADHRLWPGQFARISLRLTTLPNAIVVPSQAVQTGQDGQYVFVVKQDSTVEQRPITTGQAVAQDVVVQKGLTPGETVVTEGQLRLEPGARVTTDPAGGGGRRSGRGAGQGSGQGQEKGQGQAQGQGRTRAGQ
ncbi:MAG TPA: efflux RND transporter periplasmic adaptor subunit [Vicinamibacterales bacterium]|nr:efflux RND transporter periplasmic adaptor subunit [Vicinamibacterales bacterium]